MPASRHFWICSGDECPVRAMIGTSTPGVAQGPGRLDPGHVRHLHVQEDGVEQSRLVALQCFPSVADGHHVVFLQLEHLGDDEPV